MENIVAAFDLQPQPFSIPRKFHGCPVFFSGSAGPFDPDMIGIRSIGKSPAVFRSRKESEIQTSFKVFCSAFPLDGPPERLQRVEAFRNFGYWKPDRDFLSGRNLYRTFDGTIFRCQMEFRLRLPRGRAAKLRLKHHDTFFRKNGGLFQNDRTVDPDEQYRAFPVLLQNDRDNSGSGVPRNGTAQLAIGSRDVQIPERADTRLLKRDGHCDGFDLTLREFLYHCFAAGTCGEKPFTHPNRRIDSGQIGHIGGDFKRGDSFFHFDRRSFTHNVNSRDFPDVSGGETDCTGTIRVPESKNGDAVPLKHISPEIGIHPAQMHDGPRAAQQRGQHTVCGNNRLRHQFPRSEIRFFLRIEIEPP